MIEVAIDHSVESNSSVHLAAPLVASTTISGPYDDVVLPAWAQKPDWELELAAVISRPAYRVTVATAWEWPSADEFKQADVVVLFQRGTWNDQRAKDTDA